MPRWMFLLMLVLAAIPAQAAQLVTVAQLRQLLATEYAARKSDGSIAGYLGKMELTEELTEPALDQISADLKPGKKTAQALQVLADVSAFLEPPADEIPAKPAPPTADQIRLIQGAADFATETIVKLPDFIATRTTHSFDDSAIFMTPDASRTGLVGGGDLHPTGEYSRQITYRIGAEVSADTETGRDKEQTAAAATGLTSTGEFGPLLQIVLRDSMKGQLSWSHWEQTSSGMEAVFHYAVPQSASHYMVDFCCVLFLRERAVRSFHATPGYQGYLYLDSETGAVKRVTLEGDLRSDDPLARMAAWVEYGTVQIGEHNYLCPVRSTALTVLHTGAQNEPGLMRVNEVVFTNYHRFGSTARILPGTNETREQ